MSADEGRSKPGETGQMHKPAATLELGGNHLQETAAKQSNHPGIGPMKFVYTTGARPLDGYTIKRGVGIGGFGEVYFATSDAGKEVALKRIQRNLDVEIRGVTQCLNLKHPNLIAIYDIRYDDHGEGWIVMEFVSGESLKDVLDRNPNGMPLDEVKFWFTGIAAGVAYLHDHGIVHRDLKPGNIFSDEEVVKIGDYGLSKFISCSRRSGQTESVGTFHYMAPEIGKGVYGKEIDIYALGIMLCEMLTGCVPFEGETSQEIIMKHLTADPDLHDVPARFRRVIERALFKDPAKRFRSVSEMLYAIQFEGRRDSAASDDREKRGSATDGSSPPLQIDPAAPMYINDEGVTTDEIVFGPVVEVVATEVEKPPVVRAVTRDREPIAAAVTAGYHRVAHWWSHNSLGTPIKIAILIAVIIALILNSEWLVPMAIVLGTVYLVYFAVLRSGCRIASLDHCCACSAGRGDSSPNFDAAWTAARAPRTRAACRLASASPRLPVAQTGRTATDRTDRIVPDVGHCLLRALAADPGRRGPQSGYVGRHLDVLRLADHDKHSRVLADSGAGQVLGRDGRGRGAAAFCDDGGRSGDRRRGLWGMRSTDDPPHKS